MMLIDAGVMVLCCHTSSLWECQLWQALVKAWDILCANCASFRVIVAFLCTPSYDTDVICKTCKCMQVHLCICRGGVWENGTTRDA